MDIRDTRFFQAGCLLLFILVTTWCYYKGLFGGLSFDDTHVILENAHLRIRSLDFDSLRAVSKSFAAGGRELSMLTFGLNFYFFGEEVFGFKAVNLAFHLLTGVLLYFVAVQVLRVVTERETGSAAHRPAVNRWVPLFTCGLWIAFPINLGAVLYVSQRMAILASLFMALGMLVYLVIRQSAIRTAIRTVLLVLVTLLATLFAYHSKENGILLLGYILLVELVLFQDLNRWFVGLWRSSLAARLVIIGVAVAAAVVFYLFAGSTVSRVLQGYGWRDFSLYERVLTQFRVLSFYISQILVPNNAELSMWHDDFPLSRGLLQPATTLVSIVVIVSLLVVALYSLTRNRIISFSILWFFLGHSLESTILPLEMIHEHRNYFPSFGISLLLCYLVFSSTLIRRGVAVFVLLAFWVFNNGVLHARAGIWSNNFIKAAHEARYHPDSAKAQFNYGRFLYLASRQGNEQAARAARDVLVRNISLDRVSIASEALLIILSTSPAVDFDPAWVDSAVVKLDSFGHNAQTSRALSGLLDFMKDQGDAFDETLVAPIYETIEDHRHPAFVSFAGVYQSEFVGDREKAIALLERAEQLSRGRVPFRLNLLRIYLKEGETAKACGMMDKLDSMGGDSLLLHDENLAQVRSWLDGRCD